MMSFSWRYLSLCILATVGSCVSKHSYSVRKQELLHKVRRANKYLKQRRIIIVQKVRTFFEDRPYEKALLRSGGRLLHPPNQTRSQRTRRKK